ncbi:hypothetical protein ABTH42_19000, partial [Acinetobacter baumannii]
VEHAGVVAALIARADIAHRRRQTLLDRRLSAGQRRRLIAAQIARRTLVRRAIDLGPWWRRPLAAGSRRRRISGARSTGTFTQRIAGTRAV